MQQLEEHKGDGTSLVTYLIPSQTAMSQSLSHLTQELTTAANIKDRQNRQAVQAALRHAIARLKTFRDVPETGLALFSSHESCI